MARGAAQVGMEAEKNGFLFCRQGDEFRVEENKYTKQIMQNSKELAKSRRSLTANAKDKFMRFRPSMPTSVRLWA